MQTSNEINATERAIPSKCVSCEVLREVPFSCEDCHTLLAHVQGADYFELFGIPRDYDLNLVDLERKYLTISRNIHPDKYAVAEPEMQAFALRASAAVNNAYDVLRDPIHRAEYMLEKAGGPPASQSKQVPQDLLNQVMLLREQIEEAKAEHDQAALGQLRQQLNQRRLQTQDAIRQSCRKLPMASPEEMRELRHQLNAMKYLNNLLAHLD